MRIGLVQLPSTDDINVNLDLIRKYAEEAARTGCQVVCFPECSLTGYYPEQAKELAIKKDSAEIIELSEMATTYQLDILVGFMEQDENAFYITHGIFRLDGTTDFYHKTHLGVKEQLYFSEGNSLEVYSLSNGMRIGFQLCVESHFAEISQTLSLRGADVIFSPHAVPSVAGNRESIWMKYIPARAYDNQVYLACCNQWDEDRFGGGCLVINPRGEVVSACYEQKECLMTAEMDMPEKSKHYYPARRRKELYA